MKFRLLALLLIFSNSLFAQNEYIEQLKKEFAPDSRTAVFLVNYSNGVLKGETNSPEAKNKLIEYLNSNNIEYIDSLSVLPSALLGDKTIGIARSSIVNMRSKPSDAAELSSQILMGTPVRILKKEGGWYWAQSPDKYLGWISRGSLETMNEAEFENWKAKRKVVFTSLNGKSYSKPSMNSTFNNDLTYGDLLVFVEKNRDFTEVLFPDGTHGFLKNEDIKPLNDWILKSNSSVINIDNQVSNYLGTPYLWGGTSTRGVDCSGFTHMVYFSNGILLPRDASQQAWIGEKVDTTNNFSSLQKGDLLYFGRMEGENPKVVHVGIYLENGEYIHSSNWVQKSSFIETSPIYDEYNKKRFLFAKRLSEQDKNNLKLNNQTLYPF